MAAPAGRIVAVVGATGLQGSAVTRQLSRDGWSVRALTRNPEGKKAAPLRALGIDVVQADSEDTRSLERAFEGASGVFTVQNHHISGYEGEVRQGKNVADVAVRVGVPHVVYGAAGFGHRTDVGSWDTKVEITEYMKERGVPVTVLRPMAFMELMTASKFFPPASVWHVMPKLRGDTRPVGWLAVDDLAVIVSKALADPGRFIAADLPLAADVRSIAECRELWRQANGRRPRRLPMPVSLFERFVGTDETTMWRWLAAHDIDIDTQPTFDVHPEALSVPAWLSRRRKDRVRTSSETAPRMRRTVGRGDGGS
ncbi:MAG: NAD(P)H-binding protein [Nitriliruptorales bacterium]|nr:NAD(P)H-binding protein [Nitriliruptorales bacterium]